MSKNDNVVESRKKSISVSISFNPSDFFHYYLYKF